MNQPDALAQLAAFARVVEPTLDQRSYYELLNVDASADLPAIRKSFYELATKLHPDRYAALTDAEAKQKMETIYARMAEGYRILSDPQKRKLYDEALARGEMRLTLKERERRGPVNPEESIKHPEARKFFRLGMIAFNNRDHKGAALNFNFALTFEPGAKVIQDKLAEAKAQANKASTP